MYSTGVTSSPTSTIATSTSSSPASTSSSSSSSSSSDPGTFYKNLFYILIGLLAAFGIVSFLSLMRARHRRNRIVAEAQRLGVMVPGIPGYIPLRERGTLNWARSDGSESPDWWEVASANWTKKSINRVEKGNTLAIPIHEDANEKINNRERVQVSEVENSEKELLSDLEYNGGIGFYPLAIIPPPPPSSPSLNSQLPLSSLPYFPSHLAYRPETLLPPPPRFIADEPETLNGLSGESVDLVTLIRMPTFKSGDQGEVREEEEVVREWGGVEIGIVNVDVVGKSWSFGGE